MAVLLMLLAIVSPAGMARRAASPSPGGRLSRQQQCDVDAPRAYVDDARGAWCGDALVDKVSLKTDTRNYVAQVTLSARGDAEWNHSRDTLLARFRHIVDEVAAAMRMNVSIALRTPDGRTIAYCTRDLIDSAAHCGAR